MVEIPGFHSDLQETGIYIVMHIAPGVVDLHHIGSQTGDNGAYSRKFAGTVQKFDIQFRISAGSYQPPVDDSGEDRYINVAAGKQCHNLFAFDEVVKTTCFLADMKDFAAFNAVYAKYFTTKPARSCVAVKDLPKGVKVEVEVIATV